MQFDTFSRDWQIDWKTYFAAEMPPLESLQKQGLITLHDDRFCVTAMGWYFVRAVAMVFDYHLQTARTGTRFSRIL